MHREGLGLGVGRGGIEVKNTQREGAQVLEAMGLESRPCTCQVASLRHIVSFVKWG